MNPKRTFTERLIKMFFIFDTLEIEIDLSLLPVSMAPTGLRHTTTDITAKKLDSCRFRSSLLCLAITSSRNREFNQSSLAVKVDVKSLGLSHAQCKHFVDCAVRTDDDFCTNGELVRLHQSYVYTLISMTTARGAS